MKKIIFSWIFVFAFIGSTPALNRSKEEALQLATSFFSSSHSIQKSFNSGKAPRVAYTKKFRRASGDSIPCFYVFNKGDNNGFVIISGNDRAKQVLGYCDNGSFDINTIPDNFKKWLTFYESELKSLDQQELVSASNSVSLSKVATQNTFATSVSPLLGSIMWDQGAPYNNLCPLIPNTTTRTVTGCVATGMAQVMKYYQWPLTGTGSNSYTSTTNKISLSLDFSKTTFDWANMTNTYSSSSTTAQNNAVATLMYNCGVAVNMDYDTSSGASPYNMANALKNNFGYDTNLQLYMRDYFTRAEWINLLKTELNATRPVLFAGQSTDGGHLFVCDGYDSNNLFHFNWGWSGISNGYFQISALDTDVQGAGSTSTSGFNSGQCIVTGLQKPNVNSVPSYLIFTDDTLVCNSTNILRSNTFKVTASNVWNMGVNTFNGSIGLALYNSSGLVQVLKSSSVSGLVSQSGWNSISFSTTIPSSQAAGNYQLYLVYKSTSDTNWQILRGNVGTPNYLNVVITSTNITFSTPSSVYPNLQLNSFSITGGNLYQNKTGEFNVNITNKGGEYNSVLAIYLQSTANDTVYQFVSNQIINIATGETRQLVFTGNITMNPGTYLLATMYDPLNNSNNVTTVDAMGDFQTITILPKPTGIPNLTLNSPISFSNAGTVDKSFATLTATIQNTGGYFNNNLIAFIFPSSGGGSLGYLGYQNAIFNTNDTKSVTFSGSINLVPKNYLIAVYAMDSTSTWNQIVPKNYSALAFTLTDIGTGVNSEVLIDGMVYPNPTADVLHVKSEFVIRRLSILDLLGKQVLVMQPTNQNNISIPVQNLNSGTYIIQFETDSGAKVSKFMKN